MEASSQHWQRHPAFASAVKILDKNITGKRPATAEEIYGAIKRDISVEHATHPAHVTWNKIKDRLAMYAGANILRHLPARRRDEVFDNPEVALAAKSMFIAVESYAPLRHLGASMVDALLKTEPPRLESPPALALPHVIFSPPIGSIEDDGGHRSVEFIVCNLKEYDDSTWLVITGVLTNGNSVNVEYVFGRDSTIQDGGPRLGAYVHGEMEFAEKIRRVAVNAILVMACKPELVTEDPLPAVPAGAGFDRRNGAPGPRSVIWVGKGFKARRRERVRRDDLDGAPVAPHWRAGHWHTVRHGSGKEKARMQWYQPVLVNAALVCTS